jgi:hypothetical protein
MDKRFQDYLKQLDRKTFPKNFVVSSVSADGGSSSSGNGRRRSSESSEITANHTSINTSLTSWTTIPMPIVNDNSNPLFTTRSAWDS